MGGGKGKPSQSICIEESELQMLDIHAQSFRNRTKGEGLSLEKRFTVQVCFYLKEKETSRQSSFQSLLLH